MSLFPKFKISYPPAKVAKPAKVSEILAKKPPTLATLAAPDASQKKNRVRRYAYRFALHGSAGDGTYLTDEPDLDEARNRLLDRYGRRLALVVKA